MLLSKCNPTLRLPVVNVVQYFDDSRYANESKLRRLPVIGTPQDLLLVSLLSPVQPMRRSVFKACTNSGISRL